jgi:hypothetical protein
VPKIAQHPKIPNESNPTTRDESYLTGDMASYYRSSLPPTPHMESLYTLRPTKLVEQADGLMQYAQALYEQHEPIMRRDDRMLAEDRMNR